MTVEAEGTPDPDTFAAPPTPPLPAKVDPETLVIRARPQRAIRFRRGAIVSIAAAGSASLMAVAWLALKPRIYQQIAQQSDLSEPSPNADGDTLRALPANYGDVPKLGPPLPGDLGPPILRAQREMASENGVGQSSQAMDRAETERQRRTSELKAARESVLLVQVAVRPTEGPDPAAPSAPFVPDEARSADWRAPDPSGQRNKGDFVASLDASGTANRHMRERPASAYMLAAGSVIAASLITGLNSDLPGFVTAQVTQNVYDSATGRILLVPQGARLIGRYDDVVSFGQRRALIVWQRIILPDGASVQIDNMPATDASGYAGLEDKVDFHSWALLKGVGLSTLLGVGTELRFTGESDLVEAIRQSTQTNVARAGDQLVSRTLDIQPSITIRPGAPVRLLVQKDIIFAASNQGRN